ncbi:phosphotransferase family protein [Nocardia salmonicida]|uniref:phosphotransferase family protein n=1 Tax=Nocardia salmonicida TaxID=53431 RepID=UPI0007A52CB9|nr:phosphotransferase [Nocardia salmonicida]MBC7299451.1 phosphotransferase [Nocardia sp.]
MSGAPLDLDTATAKLTEELGADVTAGRVLRATDKSLLVVGDYHGRAAVIKVCLTDETFWHNKFGHEIGIYRAFEIFPPPTRVPELIHAANGRVIVIEHIPGRVVDTERYPIDPITPAVFDATVNTLLGFGAWNPPPGALSPVFDYPDRVERYHRIGIFDDDDRIALHRLIAAVGPIDAVAHGDPLPSNLLITEDGSCVPVDFEFTGLFAAGFDLAMLHTLLASTPGAQSSIEAIVAETDIETPFLLNQAMVLSRELRLHTELDDGEFRTSRLALIEPQWEAVRASLHDRR